MDLKRMLHITWLRRLAWGLAVCLGLGALAWSALPPLLKSQAEQRGSDALGRRLSIGTLDFKPWTLELGASEIRVASADGQSTQLVHRGEGRRRRFQPVIDPEVKQPRKEERPGEAHEQGAVKMMAGKIP